ncbi:hypothetical protein O9649_01400 [Achromobacter dolens]|uniref:hypothetical protein n=1 Tax=Achromobacter dolens TaxID=1287738 RepID=UPI0022B8DB62|nr:hypothetical protein [Achromobacter dolens]MCZ8406430.1 hypothetical protein [Achromobacter dolens]
MPIDFEPIEREFMQTLRAQAAFAGWKTRRKRCLWRALADGVEQGVELLRYRASFENRQLVSLGIYASVPCEREWPVYMPPEVWHKGRLYRRACLVPGQGLVDEATLGSGAVIELSSPADLADWLATVPADIERHVAPWFERHDTLATASYEYEIPRWRLQQAGLLP